MGEKKLYPHNQKAFEETMRMLEVVNKVAIVQATGSGKGFLASEFIKRPYNGKNILVLAPSIPILTNYRKSLGVKGENIKFATYSSIMRKYQSYLEGRDNLFEKLASNTDLLIVDEFHRIGAEKWGEAVIEYIETMESRGKKIIGLSATPVRYLDKYRDMVDEIFEGNVVQGVTLEEAIIEGILPSFKYIISVYGYNEEVDKLDRQLKRMRARNNDCHSIGLDEAEETIQKLKLQIDENAVLRNTIQTEIKNLPEPQKWIVFCSCVEELKEVNESLSYWFSRPLNVFKAMGWTAQDNMLNIFSVYTDEKSDRTKINNRNLEEFYEVDKGINIITCVNKLNEGNHIEGVSGIIMLRGTTSPTIYLQQIGRALSAGNKNKPIIFDFINNYSNLKKVKKDAGLLGITEIAKNVNTYLSDPSTKEKNSAQKIVLKNKAQDIERLFLILEDLVIPNTRWSEYELSLLREFYPMRGSEEVKRRLPKRTVEAIDSKAREMGLLYNPRKYEVVENTGSNLYWTDAENNLILQYFGLYFESGTKDRNQCARELKLGHLQHRKLYQIIDQYEKLTGKQRYKKRKDREYLNDGKRWTKNDLIYLRDCYEDDTPMEMMILVLERSEGAILSKARELGLTNSNKTSRPWTTEELKYLEKNIKKVSKDLAVELDRSEQAINHQKKRLRDELSIQKEIERRKSNQTINNRDNWSSVEEDLLDAYMDEGIEKLLEVLPHRGELETREKVQKLCNLWGYPNPLRKLS